MGRICDRSKMTPAGKFKPWIRRMCAPVAIASFLIYQSGLADMPMVFKIGYLLVTYLLWGSIFYTSINIPYGSMASAISPEPSDRQSLSTFRTMGATLAGLMVGAGVPILAYDKIDGNSILNGGRFTIIAGVFSLLAVGCYLLCYKLTTERVRLEVSAEQQQNNSLMMMFKNAMKNRALISIIVASIVMLLAQLTMMQMANYIYPNFYKNTSAQSVSTLMMMGGMIIAAALAKPLANKFGKAEVSVISNLLAALVCVVLFIIRPENVWVYVAFQALCWLGLGIFAMVSWALITDVIDYSEIKNGIREDGSIYALYSFARKMGQAASAGLSGALLSIIGYSQANAFENSVVNGIFNISTLIPALGFGLLAVILWYWYPLHKKQVDANVVALKEKHENSQR
jgi:GPH family glycoside/pentoside/hexuronide:cation symporter